MERRRNRRKTKKKNIEHEKMKITKDEIRNDRTKR